MKVRSPIYYIAAAIVVVALVSSQSATVLSKHAHTASSVSSITFTGHQVADDLYDAQSVHGIDMNQDGDMDMLTATYNKNDVSWWENDGNENFVLHDIYNYYYNGVVSVFPSDIDDDGDIDIIVASGWVDDQVVWLEHGDNETFIPHLLIDDLDDAHTVYAVDLDGDTDTDILASGMYTTLWWENTGGGSLLQHTFDNSFYSLHALSSADLDADGDPDILGAGSCGVAWWENTGPAIFTRHKITDTVAVDIHAADMDGDQDLDILSNTFWWKNDGNEHFTSHLIDSTYGTGYAYPADMDSDGHTDILKASPEQDDISWWRNDGNGNFTRYSVANLTEARYVEVADLDGDGDQDILAVGYEGDLVWWESNASDLGTIDGCVRYFGYPGIWPLSNVQVSVDPPRADPTFTDAAGEFSLDIPQDTYAVTGVMEGYVVASSVEVRTVTVTPGETAWVGFTMIDESGESGCWTPNQACANEIANIIPILGLGSELTGVVNGLCEVKQLWERGRYLWSVSTLIITAVDIADVVLVDIPTFDWLDALTECGIERLKELTKGWSISKIIESIWQTGAQDSNVLVIGVEVETSNSAATRALSASAALQVHLYSEDNHLGPKQDGTLEHTIPRSFLFELPDDVYKIAIVKDATARYELQIKGQSAATYNLSVVNPRSDGTGTLVNYKTLTVNDGSIASLALGQSTTDFTLEVDIDGDGSVDEYVPPNSAGRIWHSTIYLPLVVRQHF